ncbi:MAG TPA: hypothetical protein VKY65_05910 [Alphaproteobacteria bacterium]|nr:hypothetical protein [Alphaproteobacteria bacterium]
MTLHNELYLALVIIAFLVFTLSLAYCAFDEARKRQRDEAQDNNQP